MGCGLLAFVAGLKTLCLQNLGEAEYLVSLYQYMRLRGYPADKISILTTYNGQKALIRDVVEPDVLVTLPLADLSRQAC